MAHLRDVIKRDLVALEEGIDLGRPHDLLIDPSKHTVVAVVLTHGSAPETWVVCAAGEVKSFSTDTLAISSLQSIHLAFHDAAILKLIRSGIRLRGHAVPTQEGRRLGRITNAKMAQEGLRGDEGDRCAVTHLRLPEGAVDVEHHLILRAEATRVLGRAKHHRPGVCQELAPCLA